MSTLVTVVENESEYLKALAIRKRVFVEEQQVPAELEVDEFEASCHHFLCYTEEKPAATGRLREKGVLIKFERIATLPEFRGLGLGLELMKAMQQFALTHYPCLLPYMHAQSSAIGFYQKLGWKQIGSNFMEAGIDHVAMTYLSKDLDRNLRQALMGMAELPRPLQEFLQLEPS